MEKPIKESIGVDALPKSVRVSTVLLGRHLNQLAKVGVVPAVDPSFEDEKLKNIFQYYSLNPDEMEKELHLYARDLLDADKTLEAWQVLLTTAID